MLADRALGIEVLIPIEVFVFLTALEHRTGMRAERMGTFFGHPLPHPGKALAVPDLVDGLFINITENGVIVAAHGDVPVRVVHLKMCPGMLTDKFGQT
jgi:hypothetical protein